MKKQKREPAYNALVGIGLKCWFVLGFFIKDWTMDILPKFLLLFTTAFIVIIGLYEVLIRRFNVVRLLFGLKRKP